MQKNISGDNKIKKLNNEIKELKNKEKFYRSLVEKSLIGINVVQDGKIVYSNKKNAQNLGYTVEELTALSPDKFKKLIHKDDRDFVINAMKKRLNGKKAVNKYQFRAIKKDGTPVWLEHQVSLTKYNGKPAIQAFANEITNKKMAEVNLHNTVKKLKEREKIISLLLESSKSVLQNDKFLKTAKTIFNNLKKVTGAKSGYVALLSEDGHENEVLFLDAGGLKCAVDPNLPMPIRGLRETAYRTNKPVFNNDFMKSKWVKFMPKGHVILKNVMFIPLNISGKTVGIIGLANKATDFTEQDKDIGLAFGELAAIALKNSYNIEALNQSQNKLSAIFDNAPIIMMLVDKDRKVVNINKSGLNIAGRNMNNTIGLRGGEVLNCLHSLDDPGGCGFGDNCQYCVVRNTVLNTFETKKSYFKVEATLPLIKGKQAVERTVLVSTSCLKDQNEYFVLVSLDDITERKQMEMLLKESEDRYKSLLENINEGLWKIDKEGYTVYVNDIMADMLGYLPKEMLGKHLFYFMDDNAVKDAKQKLKSRQNGVKEVHDFTFTNKSGGKVLALLSTSPIYDKNNNYNGALAVVQDITEKNKIEEERRVNENMFLRYQRLVTLGEIAGSIAHDIRQPLQVIKVLTDSILYWYDNSDKLSPDGIENKESMEKVSKNADKINNIIKNLQRMVKKPDEKVNTEINVNEEILKIMDFIYQKLKLHSIIMDLKLKDGLSRINFPDAQFHQVISNLINNAIDAHDTSRKEDKKIIIRTKEDDKNIIIEIIDNATGISNDIDDKIFDPLFTTKSKSDSMGLGLSIIKNILISNNAVIKYINNKQGGATFKIMIHKQNRG